VRWLVLGCALAGACANPTAPITGGVTLTLDIPNAILDPKGYSSVEVTLHEPTGDVVRTAQVNGGTFDLGEIDPSDNVTVEAALRTESGAAVGYGRSAQAIDLAPNLNIVVPVRRPIVYIAGLVSDVPDPQMPNNVVWSEAATTYSDLTSDQVFDGHTTIGSQEVLMVSAGPKLFMVEQQTSNPDGTLINQATIKPVSTGDHVVAAPLPGVMTGGVIDGAGTDDGAFLVIGTTTELFLVDTASGMVKTIADGAFSRIAIANHGDGTWTAYAVQNRVATCPGTSTIVSVDFANGAAMPAKTVGSAGYSDVAADAGRAFYVDACKAELGEITAQGTHPIKTGLTGTPTALAASNGQAWVGVETAGTPATVGILVVSLASGETQTPPRMLWSEGESQVVEALQLPGVQRALDASTAVFDHIEIGAGGDYVAITIAATYHADRVQAANMPEMDIETDELRVFDAATGGTIQRYRSWCDGTFLIESINDIDMWTCATSSGQTAPSMTKYEHHVGSMTFMFGKK
jgi:hypothetical protein